MQDPTGKQARSTKAADIRGGPDVPRALHASAAGAKSSPASGRTPPPDLLIVAEQREFVRGCLVCWLGSVLGEFEVEAASNLEGTLAPDTLARSGAILISNSAGDMGDGWLDDQVAWVRAKRPDVPVIVIVEDRDLPAAKALAVRLALQGYLPTSSNVKVAAAALRLVMAGGSYFPAFDEQDRPPAQARTDPMLPVFDHELVATLTPRELAVLEVLDYGAQNKIIAYRLGISLSTVKAHVHSIIRKLHVRNRTEVVVASRLIQSAVKRRGTAGPSAGPSANPNTAAGDETELEDGNGPALRLPRAAPLSLSNLPAVTFGTSPPASMSRYALVAGQAVTLNHRRDARSQVNIQG